METTNKQRLLEYLVVAVIIIVAAFLRFYDLSLLPPGLWYDEAINGLDASTILREKTFPIFFTTEQHPREPLLIYLIALAFQLFGASKEILRGTSALIGLATIPIVYIFVKEIRRDKSLAILSALTFAILRWHFHFSRLSFRTILAPLLVTLCFLFFLRALRTAKTRDYALTGFFLGIGFYGYLSFRFVPLILLCVLIFLFLRCRKLDSQIHLPNRQNLLLMLLIALVIFSPLLIDYTLNPWHFFGRAQEVTLFSGGFLPGIKAVASQTWDVVRMFSFKGDHVSKHNLPYVSVFGNFLSPVRGFAESFAQYPVTSAVALPIALLAMLLITCHSVFFYTGLLRAIFRMRNDVVSFLLVCWFFFMLLTTIFSYGAPNLLRALVLTPVVAIFFADGLQAIIVRVAKGTSRTLVWLLILLSLCSFGILEGKRYFVEWRDHPATWEGFNTPWDDLGITVAKLPQGRYDVYVPPDIFHHPTFKFETYDRPGIFPLELPSSLAKTSETDKDRIIIATSANKLYPTLRRIYPNGRELFTLRIPYREVWAVGYLVFGKDLLPPAQLTL